MSEHDNKMPPENPQEEEENVQPTQDKQGEPGSPSLDKTPNHTLQVLKGIGILALLHLLLFFVPIAYFFIGVVQMVYLFPALMFFSKNSGIQQGLLIGAGITFLLNAACFGIFMGMY